jgi:hypothetical protein
VAGNTDPAKAGRRDTRARLLARLDGAWQALHLSYAGLSDEQLVETGVVGDWSIKDLLAHITTWEGEALKYLPVILEGKRPPRYAAQGGIDAFNARMTNEKRGVPLVDVRRQMEETHRRVLDLLQAVPEKHLVGETPFRRRLRWDTYHHYGEHAAAIKAWREGTARA